MVFDSCNRGKLCPGYLNTSRLPIHISSSVLSHLRRSCRSSIIGILIIFISESRRRSWRSIYIFGFVHLLAQTGRRHVRASADSCRISRMLSKCPHGVLRGVENVIYVYHWQGSYIPHACHRCTSCQSPRGGLASQIDAT